jgi:hypothetical protein
MDLEAMPLADLERLQVRVQAEIDFKLMRMGEAPNVVISLIGGN